MCDCLKKCQVQRCSLEKLPPTCKCDGSSEGHEQSGEEALKLKLLRDSVIPQNLSSPATFNWAVLLNIALCFSLSFWLWLFEFSSSLLHSVCLGSFPASFSPLLALCSLLSGSLASLPPYPLCHGVREGTGSPQWSWEVGCFLLQGVRHSTGCIRRFLFRWLKSSYFSACFIALGKRSENDKGCLLFLFFFHSSSSQCTRLLFL